MLLAAAALFIVGPEIVEEAGECFALGLQLSLSLLSVAVGEGIDLVEQAGESAVHECYLNVLRHRHPRPGLPARHPWPSVCV